MLMMKMDFNLDWQQQSTLPIDRDDQSSLSVQHEAYRSMLFALERRTITIIIIGKNESFF